MNTQMPDPGPIADACRTATAHNFGGTLIGEPTVTAAGIRVRMSSWPRQQEALAALHALGYYAAEDLRAGEHGAALIVTGWDTELLAARAERLENAVRGFERDLPTWADEAITRFNGLQDAEGWDDALAQEQVIAETRRAAREHPAPQYLHVSAPVDERDRLQASGQVRVLLDRVAAAETAVTKMTASAGQLAEAAIGLFLEYRDLHGYDDEAAAAKAVLEIHEGTQATRELAAYDLAAADVRTQASPPPAGPARRGPRSAPRP